MLLLNKKTVKEQKVEFEKAGIRVPDFDINALGKRSFDAPVWVHFSVGNLFKAYHAMLAQRLIEMGAMDRGIIAVAPFDHELIKKVFLPHDNLYIHVTMKADSSLEKSVVASVTEALAADSADPAQWERLRAIFCALSLQIVSLSITEKGYDLRNMDGSFKPEILKEFEAGPAAPVHGMTKLTALLYERYTRGSGRPLALVSTDNFSHNGDKLKAAILAVAGEWKARSFVDQGFVNWLSDPAKAAFPLTMIDKITPYPSEKVRDQLEAIGLGGMEIVDTGGHSANAPFVNTEEAEYLVIEDAFPNGRPPLEKAGVYFTDRATVDKVEKMKVCTCLNPLHTALAIFGCLLGYSSIAAEMKDPDLVTLVRKIAYDEGMPVVTDPGIIKPADFVREVLEKRFSNPNIPDTPQRIATDTSQKLGIRFGETIKLYTLNPALDIKKLVLIPLVLAAWCRYLLGLDDQGKAFAPSPDPLLVNLQEALEGVALGNPGSAAGKLRPILSNQKIFAVNLYDVGLGKPVESYFAELLTGPGAVRKTLQKYLEY
ncbi:mannitol-1-phosphate/altronate dehydrogenase [Treponema primitia ZAS-2]|uniref:Mannitol-1-phosphate/altronate dehydrogenase n=1 Tax=Treponema primitia (strain ATCC BAA-887 / DSM 12427 / ZAS-2) TaxID=545694 RepID=F5YKQ2_TREPZ|nr:mannitol dehydrogenase family protein [Treponema primitia]AEF85083.1 mannitol-1-phosphate/altronate dehydrogenase [Treponema primitia ZAS-2]